MISDQDNDLSEEPTALIGEVCPDIDRAVNTDQTEIIETGSPSEAITHIYNGASSSPSSAPSTGEVPKLMLKSQGQCASPSIESEEGHDTYEV